MDKLEFKQRLELISRAGAILLVALYGVGFLVVSFHDASYGIVEFGVFRTRLLSAGIIFGVFLGLPLLEASRIFGLFGLQALRPVARGHKENSGPSAFAARMMQMFLFFSASCAITFFMRWLLGGVGSTLSVIPLYAGYFAIFATVLTAIERPSVRDSVIWALMGLSVIGFLAALVLGKHWNYLWVLGWFVLVGRLTYQVDSPIREPRRLVWVNWHWVLINTIMLFGIFAIVLYPKIPPAFGGGRPTQVVLQFANVSPIDNSNKTDAWLVDETDDGYYVIRKPQDRKAIFIPKPLVSAVYLEPGESAPQH
ncbi:MAG: hypothetical protein ACYDD2_11025 [Candidatus Acidiferrales bacterium]